MLKRWDLSIWIKAKFTHFFGWSYVKNLQIKNRILVFFFFFKCGSQECCPDPDFIVAEKEPPGGASIFLMQR